MLNRRKIVLLVLTLASLACILWSLLDASVVNGVIRRNSERESIARHTGPEAVHIESPRRTLLPSIEASEPETASPDDPAVPAGSVSGVLFDAHGLPVSRALVCFTQGETQSEEKTPTVTFGEFFLGRIQPGTWKVSYKAPRAPWAAGYTYLADAVVHSGETTKLVLYVPGDLKLSGNFVLGEDDSGSVLRLRLLNADGLEVGHAQAINADPSMGSRRTLPPKQQPGYFEFAGLPAGVYRLIIQPMIDLEDLPPEVVTLITSETRLELHDKDVVLPFRRFDWLEDFHLGTEVK